MFDGSEHCVTSAGGTRPHGRWLENDDQISGAALAPSPIQGSVETSEDAYDCFTVMLSAGQRVSATLTWEGAADLDLALYDSEASDFASPTLAASRGGAHREEIEYTAPGGGPGTYGLAVSLASTESGPTSYTLEWSVPPVEPNDEIPGVALTGAPVNGDLAVGGDLFDVYRVHAEPGQRISARVTSVPATGSISLGIADTNLKSIQQFRGFGEALLRVGFTGDSPKTLYYGVPTGGAGDYYVIMVATSRVAYAYTLDASATANPGLPCTLSLEAPATSSYGSTVTLKGSLKEQDNWGVDAMPVAIYANGRNSPAGPSGGCQGCILGCTQGRGAGFRHVVRTRDFGTDRHSTRRVWRTVCGAWCIVCGRTALSCRKRSPPQRRVCMPRHCACS